MNPEVSPCRGCAQTGRAVARHLGSSGSGVNRGSREVFSHLWARTHPCVLHAISSRRRQRSRLVVHVQLGSKSWWFQQLLIRCWFVNASFSVSRRVQWGLGSACSAEQQLSAGPEAAGAGQVGGAAAVSPWCCSSSTPATLSHSWCFSELARSSLVLLSGRIASITKTNPPFLPVVIS